MPTATYGPSSAPPTLGYGQRSDAPIDAVNQWMRAQPWYQQLITSFGQNPNSVHLNDSQKQQVIKAAQAHGVVVDEGHNGQEVDNSGNFQPKSHTLRNIGIAAGIAGAVLATAGLAGAFAAPAAGAAGGVESGVTAGLGTAALPGAGTALGGAGFTATGVPLASAATAGGAAADVGAGAAAPAVGATSTIPAATYGPTGAVTNFAATPAEAGTTASTGFGVGDALKYGLPVAGNVVGSIIQANAAGNASAAQQKYLEEALAYQKEQDAYARAREASHYASYSGNIAPYVATGQAASGRMASLLGLPSAPASSTPTTPPPTTPVAGASPAPVNEPMVTLQAPTGETQSVPQSQAQHYLSLGAKPVGAAA